jgi:hypothetical protein
LHPLLLSLLLPPGVGHYVCLSWLPTYYNQEFGVDVQQSAFLSVLPW